MQSPVDPSVTMRRITKFGVEIDVCPVSGGVWLDHGELEKLVKVVEQRASSIYGSDDMMPKIDDDFRPNTNANYQQNHSHQSQQPQRKRESILGEIFDIF